MNSIQDNIKKVSKESEARTSENGNLQKLVAKGFSRKTSVIPGIMNLPSKGSPKVVNIDAVKSVDYSKGMIDWSRSGSIDLMGKGAPYVAPPTPPEPEGFSFGNMLTFDGVNDFISFPAGSDIGSNTDKMTVSFWANIRSDGFFWIGSRADATNSWLILKSATNSNGLLCITKSSNGGQSSYQTYNSSVFNSYNQWVHFTFVFNGNAAIPTTRIKMYFDSVYTGYNYIQSSPTTSTDSTTGSNFSIARNTQSGAVAEMEMSELAIWYDVLTDEEIAYLYNEGNGNFASDVKPESLRRYYRFNSSGDDSTLIDEGLDGVDGTLEGFVGDPDYWVAHE